jgi:hypothetical protein
MLGFTAGPMLLLSLSYSNRAIMRSGTLAMKHSFSCRKMTNTDVDAQDAKPCLSDSTNRVR